MSITVANDANMDKYAQHFTPELKQIYRKITNERLGIYLQGYVLGLILSVLLILYLTQFTKTPMSRVSMVCMAITVSFFVSYFYYILSPKSDMMLRHIKGEKEIQAWMSAYRAMQFHYYSSFVIGLIGVGVLAFAFRGNCA
jgi:uncharacterized protein YacL